jgi:hypothetical protein
MFDQILKERIVCSEAVLLGTPEESVYPLQSVLSRGSYSEYPDRCEMQCSCFDQLHNQGSQYQAGKFNFINFDIVFIV